MLACVIDGATPSVAKSAVIQAVVGFLLADDVAMNENYSCRCSIASAAVVGFNRRWSRCSWPVCTYAPISVMLTCCRCRVGRIDRGGSNGEYRVSSPLSEPLLCRSVLYR